MLEETVNRLRAAKPMQQTGAHELSFAKRGVCGICNEPGAVYACKVCMVRVCKFPDCINEHMMRGKGNHPVRIQWEEKERDANPNKAREQVVGWRAAARCAKRGRRGS